VSDIVLTAAISIDGFACDGNRSVERLHRWMFDPASASSTFSDPIQSRFLATGAIVFGRHTLDDGDEHWDGDTFWAPVFVVTHEKRAPFQKYGALVTFVDGAAEAVEAARDVAGDRDVHVMGTPHIARQLLRAGLIDVIDLHVVPVVLGSGSRLFPEDLPAAIELEQVSSSDQPGVHLLSYRVRR
jgi:dihydrofolate reductase